MNTTFTIRRTSTTSTDFVPVSKATIEKEKLIKHGAAISDALLKNINIVVQITVKNFKSNDYVSCQKFVLDCLEKILEARKVNILFGERFFEGIKAIQENFEIGRIATGHNTPHATAFVHIGRRRPRAF